MVAQMPQVCSTITSFSSFSLQLSARQHLLYVLHEGLKEKNTIHIFDKKSI